MVNVRGTKKYSPPHDGSAGAPKVKTFAQAVTVYAWNFSDYLACAEHLYSGLKQQMVATIEASNNLKRLEEQSFSYIAMCLVLADVLGLEPEAVSLARRPSGKWVRTVNLTAFRF